MSHLPGNTVIPYGEFPCRGEACLQTARPISGYFTLLCLLTYYRYYDSCAAFERYLLAVKQTLCNVLFSIF